jgi:predicted RNase H-like HicB family nuclease
MAKVVFRIEIFKEGDTYVSLCPELNVSSFGDTIEQAKQSLIEAVEAFVETCEEMGTLSEVLEESGFHKAGDAWVSREPVVAQKATIPA